MPLPRRKPRRAAQSSGLTAIIDIGSNSVRLAIFKDYQLILSRKAQCMLGRDLLKTGCLSPKAQKAALKTLKKFAQITHAMNVDHVLPIGTAALRAAKDGRDFVRKLEKETGLHVRLISGEDEARLSAIGVLSSLPEAEGIVADLGGGSLELACVKKGRVGKTITLPLGILMLPDYGPELPAVLEQHFADLPAAFKGQKALYAVGGTFRAMARLHKKLKDDHGELQGYKITRTELWGLCDYIRSKPPAFLAKKYKIPVKRAKALPHVTTLVEEMIRALKVPGMVISNSGLRDGVLREYYEADD